MQQQFLGNDKKKSLLRKSYSKVLKKLLREYITTNKYL